MNDDLIPLKSQRKRRAPEAWRKVFQEATKLDCYSKKGFGYSDILEITENKPKVSISRESLRVKLDRYRISGYVNKIDRGRFQVTLKGYYFFDLL